MKRPFKHIDLPTQHLSSGEGYVPPKARETDEVERRRGLRPGELVLEEQAKGARIAAFVVERLTTLETPEREYAAGMIAKSAINAAFHGYSENKLHVMRRRLVMPDLVDETGEAMTHEMLSGLAADRLNAINRPIGMQYAQVGNTALLLAGLTIEQQDNQSPYTAQFHLRHASHQLIAEARRDAYHLGAAPSLAQLAHPDSPQSVEWRRRAPGQAFTLFEQAVAEAA